MPDSAESFTPTDLRRRFHNQAVRVWIITTSVLLAWIASIVAGPLLNSPSIYYFFSYICHQLPERSLHIAGHPFAVCSRCFGIYLGLLIGVAVYPLWRPVAQIEPIARVWLFASLIPVTIDWSLTVFGVWENTHTTRVITGLILGAACATFIVPALVEVTRNLTAKRLASH
jgi:uncharacterized membrane protein